VIGVSRWDEATWSDEADPILVERGRPQSDKELLRRASDRLLASTARREGAVLVTDDVKLTKHCRAVVPTLTVWPWDRFRAELMGNPGFTDG
jgi:predicted nucleic acid-binding protein